MKVEKSWYRMQVNAEDTTAVDVFILNEIGYWGVTAAQFAQDLTAFGDVQTIHLHLNSPGGDVMDGTFIHNYLKAHKATVKVYISGLAASMASIIALAGDEVNMAENSYFMIHQPSMGWGLTAEDLEKYSAEFLNDADVLRKISNALAKIYTDATGMSAEEIQALMDKTTWLTAQEALDMGFITGISDPVMAAANVSTLAKMGVPIPAKVKAMCKTCGAGKPASQSVAKPAAKPAVQPVAKPSVQPVAKPSDNPKDQLKGLAGFLKQARQFLGMGQRPRAGAALGTLLTSTIDGMTSDTVTRDSIVSDMATASGQETDAVEDDISGTNTCPTLAVLTAYSTVLTTTLAALKTAAESDGCDYADAEAEAEEQAELEEVARALHEQLIVAQTQLASAQEELAIAKGAKPGAKAATQPATKPATKPAAKPTKVPEAAKAKETSYLDRAVKAASKPEAAPKTT